MHSLLALTLISMAGLAILQPNGCQIPRSGERRSMHLASRRANRSHLFALALVLTLAAACGEASESDSAEDGIGTSVPDQTDTPVADSTTTTERVVQTETPAPTPSSVAPTTSTPETSPSTAPPIELVKVEFLPSDAQRIVYDEAATPALFTEVVNAFAPLDLEWASDTIWLAMAGEPVEGDVSAVNNYVAYVETKDGLAFADVEETQSVGYFRNGINTGQEGYTCLFWGECPAGLSAADYENRTVIEVFVSNVEHSVGACAIPAAGPFAIRISACP